MTIFDEVKADLDVRNAIGWKEYKKELMPDEDKNFLLEAYHEALDLCVYLKGELLKRERSSLLNAHSATRSRTP